MILKKVKKLNEALTEAEKPERQRETIDVYIPLFNEIRAKDSKFANLLNESMYKILLILSRDSGVNKHDITVDQYLDFINQWKSFGAFIFDYGEDLSAYAMWDIGKEDPKFVDAINSFGVKYHLIDKDGTDPLSEVHRKVPFQELCKTILNDNILDKENHFVMDDFIDTISEIEDIYKGLGEALIEAKKDEESEEAPAEEAETTEIKPDENPDVIPEDEIEIPGVEEPAAEDEAKPLEDIKPSEEVLMNNANKVDLLIPIQEIIDVQWNNISTVKNLISEITETYEGENKEQAISILNQMLDDYTINVGMLHKVIQLTNPLIEAGETKAEEIIK